MKTLKLLIKMSRHCQNG